MKRLISLLVVIAMVMSLVPVTFAEEAGVKITYDPSIFGFNQNIADISYENTSGFFSYHSRKDGWNPAHGDFRTNGATDTMGMVAHHHTAGDWYAIELNVPAAGDYDVSIQCVKRTYGSNKAYLYFLDSEEAKDIEANLTEENKFSENSFYDTGNYVIDEYAEGTVSFASSGKYLLVVQGTENWTYTSIGKIVLDGGNGTAVMGAVAKITDDEISVGEKSQIDVSAYRSDGGEIMLYPDEKSFESSDESIVMVDQSGVITALSEGDAKITATVSWNGKEYKSTASISVVTKTSDVKVFYDFIDNFTSDVPYTTGELTFLAPSKQTNFVDTYEKTFGFWKFASAPSGLSVNHCYSTTNARNNGFRAYFYNDKNWFAINVRVPVTDTYDVVLGYDVDISFDNELKVHILNGEASDTVIAESIANGTGLIGSVNCTTGKQDGTQKATLGKSQLSAGEHTVVFYAPNSKNIRLHSLSLSAGSGEKSAIMSADMSLSPSGKLSVSGILSDEAMSNADMSTATVKYTGQNPDIATVSADGTVEVLTAGKLTVTAEIIYGEQTLEIQKSFDVAEKEKLAPSETVQFYDFMKVSPDWLSPMQTEGDPRNEDIRAITYGYTDGNWQWHSTDETSYSKPRSDVAWVYQGEPWGRMRLLCGIGQYIALTVKVPQPGRYFAELEKKDYHSISAEADLYIIPMVDEANVQRTLAANESLGHVNCLNRDVADYTVVSQDLGVVEFETAGEYLFVVKKTHGTWGDYINLKSLTLDGRNIFKLLTLESDTDAIHMGEAAHLDVTAALLDGTELDASELNIRYTTSDADVATVSRNGVVTGLRDGTVTITAIVTHNGETHSASKTFDVIDASGVKRAFIDVPESIYVTDRKQAMLCIEMNSGYIRKIDPSLVRFEVVSQNPSNAASIDSFGYITANKEGTITLSANTWFDGARRETEEIKIALLPSGKKSRTTIYTQEMRDTAIANSRKYDWAKSEVKAAKELADRYVDLYGSIYSSVTGKGLPTSRQIGGYGDPEYMICRYCGVDTSDFANGGNGRAFTWDIINRPWKIQCPGCKRVFPSNDFESFYNLGLDKNGLFDRDRALEEHEEIFGGTYGTGYLKNTLYPELADTINNHRGLRPGETVETWGVDDGWGYVPKDADGNQYRYANGKGERHPYIAYYNYFTWGESRREILEALKTAYIYTGDIKYGRAGAIILDRIADVWPDMDSSSYTGLDAGFFITDGGNFKGKTQGCIDDCVLATLFSECADAFFPALEDPQVISFLSARAEDFGLENKKESAYDIWSNWENGIIETAYESVKKTQIGGNFGQHQFVVTTAAVALDSQPKTNDMLDYVFRTGEETKTSLSGGNVASTLVDVITRDGMGNEASPQYNYIWIERLLSIADLLGRYTDDESYNLWNNTKFVQMFMSYPPVAITSNESVQVGDSGGFGTGAFRALPEDYIPAFKYLRHTKNAKRIANYIYLISGEETDGLHYDIMTENPEVLETEIESYLDPELGWFSEILTGYGFGMLRSGTKYDTIQNSNFKRGIYMNFGRSAASHGHKDALNIGITAYDLNMTPDLGYPSNTGTQPQRLQWVSNTLSHNTIVVNEKAQTSVEHGYPQHFDDSGKVKLLDVDASGAYAETDIYRRTLVTVDIDDRDSYMIDFFRVVGGDDHLFSFHVAGDTISETSLTLGEEQPGSYADPNWPYGQDPNSPAEYYYDTVYPKGYTWLKETRRAEGTVGEYDIDFEIKDYKNRLADSRGLHLRMTQLNDFELNELAVTTGHPPTNGSNIAVNKKGIKYVLARRTGENLNSLFTTVYEPYKENRRLDSMTSVDIAAVEGTPGANDTAKAIKVIRESGRIDYIMYATNNTIKYVVTDGETKIDFRGFVGVYSVENGVNVYSYLNDGDILGTHTAIAAITGEVIDFSRDLSLDNYITVKADADVDVTKLSGKMIVVDNDMVKNGAYYIESAEKLSDGNIKLDIGTVSAIRKYKDANDFDAGFIYNINPGQSFKIATTFVEDSAPLFDAVNNNLSTSSGSAFDFAVNAKSDVSDKITYEATSVPRGASVDAESGKISWKPTAGQVGDNLFTITAYDEDGRYNSINFVVKVYGSTSGGPGGGSSGGGGSAGGTDKPTEPEKPQASEKPDVQESGKEDEKAESRFLDLASHTWAEDAINSLADEGIIRGTSENTYSPAKNITRADFAILLVRAFEKTSENTENFADVSDSDYFAKELAIARNTGLVSGIGDNKFAPRENIKRCDMMLMIYRVLLETDAFVGRADSNTPDYADFDTVPDYAKEAVSALIGAELVNGKNGLIAPNDFTTRAEVAVLLRRVLDYIATK